MRDFFKKMLLNYENENLIHEGNNRFVFNNDIDENSWQSNYINKDKNKMVHGNQQIEHHSVFNTDTKLSALNGLSIWEFTAVLIAFCIGLSVLIWTIKKMIILMVNREHKPLAMNDSFNSDKCPNQYDAVHKSFTIDSYEQLTENVYSKRNTFIPDIV